MAFFAADDDQRDVSAVLQYRGQHDCRKVRGGIGTAAVGASLPLTIIYMAFAWG